MISDEFRDLSTPIEFSGIKKSNLTSSEDLSSLFSRSNTATPQEKRPMLRRSPRSSDFSSLSGSMKDFRPSSSSTLSEISAEASSSSSGGYFNFLSLDTRDAGSVRGSGFISHSLEAFSERRLGQPSIIFEIRSAFESRGLAFESHLGMFVYPDSTFSDIKEVVGTLSENAKAYVGELFYNARKRAICSIPGSEFQINYPDTSTWISLLKLSREKVVYPFSCLTLTEGRSCSESDFVKESIFKSTLEKHSVFLRLCKLRDATDFEERYDTFLQSTQTGDFEWAKTKPLDMAYFALFAYLDGKKINKEELFVAQMLASAFLESPDSAAYIVLTQENVDAHLKQTHYLTPHQTARDFACVASLEGKSPLERMAISYKTQTGIDFFVYELYKESRKLPMGFKEISEEPNAAYVTILPPWFSKKLYEEIFSPNFQFIEDYPPTEHSEFFGYKEILKDLVKGRPISYASPLFYIPEVHGRPSKQLGITAHDVVGHCVTDWMHPYSGTLIELGVELRELDDPELFPLAFALLDRAVESQLEDYHENVCNFIMNLTHSLVDSKLSIERQDKFFNLCEAILPDVFLDKMQKRHRFEEGSRTSSSRALLFGMKPPV